MNSVKNLLVRMLFSLAALGLCWFIYEHPPVLYKAISNRYLGRIGITRPMWRAKVQTVIFMDTEKFRALDIGQRLSAAGIAAVIVDAPQVLQNFKSATGRCLDADQVSKMIDALLTPLPGFPFDKLIIAGVGDGGILPFVNAHAGYQGVTMNLSIGFSINLPDQLLLCQPFVTEKQKLLSSTDADARWRSVWTDQPDSETALFIRGLGKVETRIAAYDTALDEVLIDELLKYNDQLGDTSPPMPVVETPAAKSSESLTIFYSGDGGWRDLDRTVAGEMASRNFPVVGVDVLRYFWEHKTAEQAAADLTGTLAYYRRQWGVKSFVLAGYSFGADIMPALYNRLSKQDQDSISLLVLLALGHYADFEIHVSGWLGKDSAEQLLEPELLQIPRQKILCVYGQEEKTESACSSLTNSEAVVLELPGGHHFDEDYPKLTRQILDVYRQHGVH